MSSRIETPAWQFSTATFPIISERTNVRYFDSYLADLRDIYLVIQDGAEIIACGAVGLHPRETDAAKLEWGMVLKSRHKTGLGRRLLIERLNRIASYPTTRIVLLNTSQFSAGFFTKMGFETQRVIPDGYCASMDKHEMRARLPLQLTARKSA